MSDASTITTFRFRAPEQELDMLEQIAHERFPHEPFPVPTALREALEEYLAKHRREIGR